MYVQILMEKKTFKIVYIRLTKKPVYRPDIADDIIMKMGLLQYNAKYDEITLYLKGRLINRTLYILRRKDRLYGCVSDKNKITNAMNMVKYHLYNDKLIVEIEKFHLLDGEVYNVVES